MIDKIPHITVISCSSCRLPMVKLRFSGASRDWRSEILEFLKKSTGVCVRLVGPLSAYSTLPEGVQFYMCPRCKDAVASVSGIGGHRYIDFFEREDEYTN